MDLGVIMHRNAKPSIGNVWIVEAEREANSTVGTIRIVKEIS